VRRGLARLGAQASAVGGATTHDGSFLGILAALLRAVAAIDALVCLYALVQALALTARERRPTLSLLRATGAPARTIAAVLAGATLVVTIPAAAIALGLERWVLAPAVGGLAAGYADLAPQPAAGQALLVAAGLAVLGLLAAAWVARAVVREPPVAGLREE
jgi:ABC-type antimicrobial peptide transport system permease subunit